MIRGMGEKTPLPNKVREKERDKGHDRCLGYKLCFLWALLKRNDYNITPANPNACSSRQGSYDQILPNMLTPNDTLKDFFYFQQARYDSHDPPTYSQKARTQFFAISICISIIYANLVNF